MSGSWFSGVSSWELVELDAATMIMIQEMGVGILVNLQRQHQQTALVERGQGDVKRTKSGEMRKARGERWRKICWGTRELPRAIFFGDGRLHR